MECLCHPNVIHLFEVIETFPRMYLVMECAAEGNVLDRIITSGPFTNEFGRSIFIQVASAIDHMVCSFTLLRVALFGTHIAEPGNCCYGTCSIVECVFPDQEIVALTTGA